ncbi:TIGR01177 family methyltransferase [Haloarcula hispanica]|uniref:tRNA (guanine(10)-N(2))-dimethyltransferase n=1 Tax=Haloarcula hispanica TaxID=51589 RepID=A0A5J5LGE3_HALHI|nr:MULTISPECIES: TIGR01177 family methyltransferase [Haloarcula]KAA9405598.1 TIGR01177 family methyltransferase [Haloarcula sp. CBA1131]KAA9408523.1 TIGR01177 family methyltransferase [Haloarcula hispanica]
MYVLELGGQDDAFARREAASAASAVDTLAPGLATARGISDRVRHLAFTHRACDLIGTADPDIESAAALLSAATIDRKGSVAVRAVDVRASTGIDTQQAERTLGGVLTDRGFAVDLDDPDHVLYAYLSDPAGDEEGGTGEACCAVGWLATESVRDFGGRQPTDRPFFQPGSMDPLEARALVNIAGAGPEATILDPMCGTGGLLLEAGLVGADVVGGDAQEKMVSGTRENLSYALDGNGHPNRDAYPDPGDWGVFRSDASKLPVADDAVDAVVFDAPYGRQSRIEGELAPLVSGALGEADRVTGRCVLVADRDWREAGTGAGWTVTDYFQRRVHRSLVRHVHVLE